MTRRLVLLIVIIGQSLTMLAQEGESTFLIEFQQKWQNAMEYSLAIAEMMPADKYDYKPTEDVRSFHDQLVHSLRNMNWLNSKFLGGEKVEFSPRDSTYLKTDLLALSRECFAKSGATIASMRESDLSENMDGFFAGPMTKRQILVLMNDHLTHHRGQMIVYLRLNGLEPPRYRGW